MKKKQIEPIFDKMTYKDAVKITDGMLNAMAGMVTFDANKIIKWNIDAGKIKEAGLAITPAPSEKTKVKEKLKDPTLRTIERSVLEIYYESL